ncbi:CHAT domain-containing protein [Oscillatoria salina]|uniref:CHAT domain-containing protein n=1 Tax=Oscillatoria salina TaxID=331517 RepID=UPI0013BA3F55|nr:CHAT domain-containing protein [Oscillatoria salina]MBZ8182869.1 CHAT domain-containing protein [Oscillatoria salina IIICB1]NET87075.1 CHAT domain-containing protein [Kamptonema sp. SIO1D9]
MPQEFQLSVTPLGNDEYLVRTEKVAPGVPPAEEKVIWSTEEWLAQAKHLMNDPLLRLLQGNSWFEDDFIFTETDESETANQSSLNLVSFGKQLYQALFYGKLRESWAIAQGIAHNQRSYIRLRLGFKDVATTRLPWEVLHAEDRPLASVTDIAFSRYQPNICLLNPAVVAKLEPEQPLKILMAIAAPSDRESLELKREARELQEELRYSPPNNLPPIELTILEQPGREQLTQALEQGSYQVFHYAGHSNLGESGGDIYLVSRQTGLTERIYGDDLAGLLVNNGIKFAVFNSCRGAFEESGESVTERNLAQALVKRGIPAVLAMAERIPDRVALSLTKFLYRNINQGYPIDKSVSRARQGLISAYGSNQLYWALPVLYLHPEFDGSLIDLEPPTDEDCPEFSDELLIADNLTEEEEALFLPSERMTSASFFDDRKRANKLPRLPNDLSEEDDLGFEDRDEDEFLAEFSSSGEDDEEASALVRDLLSEFSGNSPITEVDSEQPEAVEEENIQLDKETVSQPEITAVEPEATTNPQPAKKAPSRWRNKGLITKLLSATGLVAIAVFGLWFFLNREPTPRELLSNPLIAPVPNETSEPDLSSTINLETAETSTVAGIAIEQFSQGNIEQGEVAVLALLERNALPQAQAALAAVPPEQLNDPEISFLRGRLAWQFVKVGNENYSISDARRYWEIAFQQGANSVIYLNALGFAYYSEGQYNEALQAWYDALDLMEKQPEITANLPPEERLNPYAGLALGLWKLAENQSGNQQEFLDDKAIKLRQKVITEAPEQFRPEALASNWMWLESAIADWQELLKTSSQ